MGKWRAQQRAVRWAVTGTKRPCARPPAAFRCVCFQPLCRFRSRSQARTSRRSSRSLVRMANAAAFTSATELNAKRENPVTHACGRVGGWGWFGMDGVRVCALCACALAVLMRAHGFACVRRCMRAYEVRRHLRGAPFGPGATLRPAAGSPRSRSTLRHGTEGRDWRMLYSTRVARLVRAQQLHCALQADIEPPVLGGHEPCDRHALGRCLHAVQYLPASAATCQDKASR